MSGFATWGQAIQRMPAGETVFGTPINVLEAPFLHGVTIVEAPLLRPYTAIALTSSEVYIRNKRNPYWNLRGNRGDMVEGDWIAEMAIEVVNEVASRLGRGNHGVLGELITQSRVRAVGSSELKTRRSQSARFSPLRNSQLSTKLSERLMWRFRGSPHYLDAQAARLGLPKVLADRARHNAEIYPRAGARLAALRAHFTERGKRTASPSSAGPSSRQIRGTLEQAELELQKLHMLAAASAAMLDEAWKAFGIDKRKRPYEVMCDFDTGVLPLGDGTVGVAPDAALSAM